MCLGATCVDDPSYLIEVGSHRLVGDPPTDLACFALCVSTIYGYGDYVCVGYGVATVMCEMSDTTVTCHGEEPIVIW